MTGAMLMEEEQESRIMWDGRFLEKALVRR